MLHKIKDFITNVVNGIKQFVDMLFTKAPTLTLSYGVAGASISLVAILNIIVTHIPGTLLVYELSTTTIVIPATILGVGLLAEYIIGMTLVIGTLLYIPNKIFNHV